MQSLKTATAKGVFIGSVEACEALENDPGLDLSVDAEEFVLSFYNADLNKWKAFVVTIEGKYLPLRDFHSDRVLEEADEGVVTICACVPPCSVLDACVLSSIEEGRISSDVQAYEPFSAGIDRPRAVIDCDVFPKNTRVLVSQGEGGKMTHFFKQTYFAIDLDVPLKTTVLSPVDGVVVRVRDSALEGGCHVDFLYEWNAVVVKRSNDDLNVELVHLDEIFVSKGDRVVGGSTVLGLSGRTGFCPSPHVHMQTWFGEDESLLTPFEFKSLGRPFKEGEEFVV